MIIESGVGVAADADLSAVPAHTFNAVLHVVRKDLGASAASGVATAC